MAASWPSRSGSSCIDEAATLQECLDACRSGDRHMTEIATAGGVNAEAAR
jgi:hypothetical protein